MGMLGEQEEMHVLGVAAGTDTGIPLSNGAHNITFAHWGRRASWETLSRPPFARAALCFGVSVCPVAPSAAVVK